MLSEALKKTFLHLIDIQREIHTKLTYTPKHNLTNTKTLLKCHTHTHTQHTKLFGNTQNTTHTHTHLKAQPLLLTHKTLSMIQKTLTYTQNTFNDTENTHLHTKHTQ